MNKYLGVVGAVLLSTGCSVSSMNEKEAVNCGQLENTILSSVASPRIGPADAVTVSTVLTQFNNGKKWISGCGASVVAVPTQPFFDDQKKEYCRGLVLEVDGKKANTTNCLSGQNWTVVASDVVAAPVETVAPNSTQLAPISVPVSPVDIGEIQTGGVVGTQYPDGADNSSK